MSWYLAGTIIGGIVLIFGAATICRRSQGATRLMASGEAARPIVDELCVPLTRPPTVMGVRYEYFAINGLIVTILFIATSRFASFCWFCHCISWAHICAPAIP